MAMPATFGGNAANRKVRVANDYLALVPELSDDDYLRFRFADDLPAEDIEELDELVALRAAKVRLAKRITFGRD